MPGELMTTQEELEAYRRADKWTPQRLIGLLFAVLIVFFIFIFYVSGAPPSTSAVFAPETATTAGPVPHAAAAHE